MSPQLHDFSDAFFMAYGAAIYLRTLHINTTVTITLVTAKMRVAPIKSLTITKLELID